MDLLLIIWLIGVLLMLAFYRPAQVLSARVDDRHGQARQRFWLHLYGSLAHRVRRIWRYCRRHYGWGIEILSDPAILNLFA